MLGAKSYLRINPRIAKLLAPVSGLTHEFVFINAKIRHFSLSIKSKPIGKITVFERSGGAYSDRNLVFIIIG